MNLLRTPDERFQALPGCTFAPHHMEVETEGLSARMHVVDEGPREAPPVLLLHGEPTWSYLYRTMIPPLVTAGHRVVAPDLIGFGKSDKPTHVEDYTYARHVGWVADLLKQMDLTDITLVCQDWGSLIGLRLAAEHEARFARIVIANGYLPEGGEPVPFVFTAWQAFARWTPWFPAGRIVAAGCAQPVAKAIRAAYDAPFPNRRYQAGARAFPRLVPTLPDDPAAPANKAAWAVLERWTKPVLTAFATGDPIFRGADKRLQRRIPGATGQPHTRIRNAGHFIQEDQGPELARIVHDFIAST